MDPFVVVSLAVIAGIPVCVALFALAAWLQPRAFPRDALATAVASVPDPAAEEPRLRGAARLLTWACAVFLVTYVVLLAVELLGTADAFMVLIVAPFVALSAACAGLLLGRVRGPATSLPGRPAHLADLAPARLLGGLAGTAAALAAGFVVAGTASTRDLRGRHFALDHPSIVDWEVAGGQIVDVVYAPGMVTTPWPGWAWSVPTLGGAIVSLALLQAVVVRLTSARGEFAAGRPVLVDALRRHAGTVTALLALAALAFTAGPAMFVAGTALASASLVPQPAPDGLNINATIGYLEPMHTAALLLQYGGWAVGLAGIALAFLALIGARAVERARRTITLVSRPRPAARPERAP